MDYNNSFSPTPVPAGTTTTTAATTSDRLVKDNSNGSNNDNGSNRRRRQSVRELSRAQQKQLRSQFMQAIADRRQSDRQSALQTLRSPLAQRSVTFDDAEWVREQWEQFCWQRNLEASMEFNCSPADFADWSIEEEDLRGVDIDENSNTTPMECPRYTNDYDHQLRQTEDYLRFERLRLCPCCTQPSSLTVSATQISCAYCHWQLILSSASNRLTDENIGRVLGDIHSLMEAHSQSGCASQLGWAEYRDQDAPDAVLAMCPLCDWMNLIALN